MPLLREFTRVQSVRGVSRTNARAYLVQMSDQRGAFLVENLQRVVCVCNNR